MLCGRIIDHLIEERFDNTSYFYCRGNEQRGSNCLSLYKSLLRQFIRQNEDLLPIFLARKSRDREVLVDENLAKSLIDLSCEMNFEQYIIIDGLDELSDRERFDMVQFLVSIVNKSNDHTPGKIRLLLLSQDLPDMRKLMKLSAEILDLQPSDTEQDVEMFVGKQLEKIKEKFDLTDQQTQQTRLLVLKGTNGKHNFNL